MKIYAVVDAGNAPGLLEMIKTLNPPASCLYNSPLQEGMAERAPYLIELESDEVKAWLAKQTQAWGLYLVTESDTDFLKLRSHLRKYTFAMIPISEKPVFFRFYDPRVFWKVTDAIDDWQLHAFLGPIEIVATYYDEQYKQDHFEERRKQFPKQIKMKTMYLTLTEAQFERINGTYEEEYIQELADHMMKYVDLSIIEQSNNDPDKIHKEMLEHERDIKHAQINHPIDQNFLLEQNEKDLRSETPEKAYFRYSKQTKKWQRVQGNQITPPNYFITIALHKLARNPISEEEFHELTNFKYVNQNNETSLEVEEYQSNSNNKPYFYHQNDEWYYVDHQEYAHPIMDERTYELNQLNTNKIFEDAFHQITQGKYKEYLGQAYLPEKEIIEDKFKVTSMEDLKQTVYLLASNLDKFCQSIGIEDKHSTYALAKLIAKNNILHLSNIPRHWMNELQDTRLPAYYRVRLLVAQLIGEEYYWDIEK